MNRYLHRLAVITGALLIALGTLTISFTPALATVPAADPMVVIAQDTTTLSACMISSVTSSGTVESPCPAGSVITSEQVPLSKALAEHEAYVLLPPRSISRAEAAKVEQQIQDMMRAKGNAIHHRTSATTLSPLVRLLPATCQLWAQLAKGASWHPGFDLNSTMTSIIDYQVDGVCDLDWLYSEIDLTKVGGPLYWEQDKYSGWSADQGCTSIARGWNTKTSGGNFNTPGYYYEQWVSNGSNCFPWDSDSYVDIGPLTNY